MPFATYDAALDYLFAATDYEKMQRVRYNADTFSLDRMRRLLEAMGSPERRLRSVHVAGTKGKGSTAAMVHALAMAGGLQSGLYTSPHLVDIRERIRIGPDDIAPETLRRLIEAVQPHIERLRAEGEEPTFFEIFTAMAFRHFADAGVDLVVAEVGLGGRLDATNVLAPEVSVLTAISFDHTLQLGGTLAAIAGEKAGIIKPGVPVVSQPQPPEALGVIEAACEAARSPLILVGRDVTYQWKPAAEDGVCGGRLTVHTPRAACADLFVPLMGEHQAVNACAAVAAAEQAPALAGRLTEAVVRRAMRSVRWPGRMELLSGRPDTLLDGAHNRASMECLAEGLARYFPGRRIAVIFGCAADKDIDGMLEVMGARLSNVPVVFTRSDNPRSADAADLRDQFGRRGGRRGEIAANVAEAIRAAARQAGPDGLVVVCGSLYLVGEAKKQQRMMNVE
jgi:dihydrofolate synthase/folylpolyglutamate synthase